jgi:MFS family permease
MGQPDVQHHQRVAAAAQNAPSAMLGRVTGTYRTAVTSVMVVGALIGGAVASIGGLRLPLLIFGLWCLVLTALMRNRLTNDVVDQAVAARSLSSRFLDADAASRPVGPGRRRMCPA